MDLNRLNHTEQDSGKPTYVPPQVMTQDVAALLRRLGPARAFSNNRSGNGLLDDLLNSND